MPNNVCIRNSGSSEQRHDIIICKTVRFFADSIRLGAIVFWQCVMAIILCSHATYFIVGIIPFIIRLQFSRVLVTSHNTWPIDGGSLSSVQRGHSKFYYSALKKELELEACINCSGMCSLNYILEIIIFFENCKNVRMA